ncbi:hypothetical protein SAMN05443244_1032 [Terriglobus roseus]|uniref:Uncharacterized protein n=1 Tax=Terriglobus roseus TaxID=392734 RepID=A0A1H4K716_9BACT|nr:hypothetical protein SAMN05443244_1032 [Terriglobus roseus]
MESCFVLSIESDGELSLVTYSVEGVLSDGQRMVLRHPTPTAIGQIVRALNVTEALEPAMIEAINHLKGSYRLYIDIEEGSAMRFVDARKGPWSTRPNQ